MNAIKLASIIFLLFLSTLSNAQKFSKANLIADLDDYEKKIIRKHAHPFNYITQEQFVASLSDLKKNSVTLNDDQLMVGLMKVNALLRDPHTGVSFNDQIRFPIETYWYDEGFFIVNTSNKYMDYLGCKLIKVNGFPIDTVINKLSSLVGSDNRSWIKNEIPTYISTPFILHGMNLIPEKEIVVYTLVKGNDTLDLRVEASDEFNSDHQSFKPDKPLLRNSSTQNYWYEFDEPNKTIYLNYVRCVNMPSRPFSSFLEKFLADFHKYKPAKLIIDLRYNSGGSVTLFSSLTDSLAADSTHAKTGLYVLTGRRTFSAGVVTAFNLKNRLNAVLIGEETGGDLNHPGFVKSFVLKRSKVTVHYSDYDLYLDARVKAGILPDIFIPVTFSDFKKGIDPALNRALTTE